MDKANAWLAGCLNAHNARFAVPARYNTDMYRH
jgi:hypothetical protein